MNRVNLCEDCLKEMEANKYLDKIIEECKIYKSYYSCFHQYIKNRKK
jgi:hypothetical protein